MAKSVDGFEYHIVHNADVIIDNYIGNKPKIIIPLEIEGLKVSTIGENAFKDNQVIQEVTLLSNLEYIEKSAFENCTNLTTIVNKASIIYIGERAFYNCVKFERFTTNKFSKLNTIGAYAFTNSGIINFKDARRLNYIGPFAFANCPRLNHINIKSHSSIVISDGAFYNCTTLLKVDIQYVKEVKDLAFAYNDKLVELNIGFAPYGKVGKNVINNKNSAINVYYYLKKPYINPFFNYVKDYKVNDLGPRRDL